MIISGELSTLYSMQWWTGFHLNRHPRWGVAHFPRRRTGSATVSAVLEANEDTAVKDLNASLVRIVALVREGSVSPLKSAPWLEVMLHTVITDLINQTALVQALKSFPTVIQEIVQDLRPTIRHHAVQGRKTLCSQFHWRCKKNRVVNLCFADDLLIFCNGDTTSVGLIKEALTELENLSGLSPNLGKSSVFFSGVMETQKKAILDILGFREGKMPVRYLGLALLTSKLKYSDCLPLIERITMRVKGWTNRALSFAGRLQLIKSILFSMQVYWASIFILPKRVIKEVNNILRKYFWSGADLQSTGAKIAWDDICIPKDEGGLGSKEASEIVYYPYIANKMGNGKDIFMWFDNWHPLSPLLDHFGSCILLDSAYPRTAKLESFIRVSLGLRTSSGSFTINSAWDRWRSKQPQVEWSKLIWFPGNVPRIV
ncbi:violaxanthin de-epoxidase-like protein [Actinidia rufa]|uniref:Violaxanthin de-epoxidase-like protein n=1 Tax=Actinidia rufa TaxID=165716 RepID=A0A7J0GQ61_9ERIC|nr:violaxanthin de-epoxidase-like protein [Actinidia rufa]